MRSLCQARAIEDFLEKAVEAGDTVAEMRRNVSCEIFLHELHALYPLRDQEFFIDAAVKFHEMEERKK